MKKRITKKPLLALFLFPIAITTVSCTANNGNADTNLIVKKPTLKNLNVQYSPELEYIYNLSLPLLFVFERLAPQYNGLNEVSNLVKSTVFLNGTGWVFDRTYDKNQKILNYYIATNLHVINLWADEKNLVNPLPIDKLRMFIGSKENLPAYNKKNVDSNSQNYPYKWKVLPNSNNKRIDLREWETAWNYYDFPDLREGESNEKPGIVLGTSKNIAGTGANNLLTFGAQLGGFRFELMPQLGLLTNSDIGIIKLSIPSGHIASSDPTNSNANVFKNFNDIMDKNNNDMSKYYDLSTIEGNNKKISGAIGGFPVVIDNNSRNGFSYSAWNSWEDKNKNTISIREGNSNRGKVIYQNFESNMNTVDKYNFNKYYGDVPNANLFHGSSGSMVIDSQKRIQGIYWGGLTRNNGQQFAGRFVPLACNNILLTWSKLMKNNIDGEETLLSHYFNL